MAHYAIMRGEKRKTGDVRGVTAHIARSQPTPNADSSKAHLNYAVVGPAWDDQTAINDAIEARTPKKYRKDAVRAIEYVVSASPEWFEQNSEQQAALYFERAVDWFQDQFGAANVVSAVVHNDESSPHMHVLVVPLDAETGRLNGKFFFGNKGVLQKRQSRFAEHMSPFGVERGKADPQRSHTKVHEWRAGHAQLDDREAALKNRENAVKATAEAASKEAVSAAADYAAAREARSIAQYEGEVTAARSASLDDREKALSERETRIQRAERSLSKRAKALEAAARQFEQQKAAWIAENKPQVSPIIKHLKYLETLSMIESAEYLAEQDNDELYDLFSPQEGLTGHGKALLDRYKTVQERAEKFEETFTPSSSGPGL